MNEQDSAKLCANYHIARARLLVDCLADSPRAVRPEVLETTLRMITAELALAAGCLDRERPPPKPWGVRQRFAQRVPG
jgi:hypothetical protein